VLETDDDLGTLYAIELIFEQCVKTSNNLNLKGNLDLHLLKVEVCEGSFSYVFLYDKFVSIQEMDNQQYKMILLEKSAEIF
jgi:hypothetical protein